MNKAIFLVGVPGSGKDIILTSVLSKYNLKEYKLEQIKKTKLQESIIISANAFDESIPQIKELLENSNYSTAMIFVDTTNAISKQRMAFRNNFSEESRLDKFNKSKSNQILFKSLFENFILFENNSLIEDSQLKPIEIFTHNFIFDFSNLFEAKELKSKLLKKYSPKKSNLNDFKADNVSFQDYEVKDTGFPASAYSIMNQSNEVTEEVSDVPDMTPFTSEVRSIQNPQFYATINKVKDIAKKSWNKNGKHNRT